MNGNQMAFCRFIPIGSKENMDRLKSLMEEKSLSSEDLKLVLETIKLNPDIDDFMNQMCNSLAKDFASRLASSRIPIDTATHYDPAIRDSTWRRFELIAPEEIKDEFYEILERLNPSRRELAVLVSSLRVLPGLSLSDPAIWR